MSTLETNQLLAKIEALLDGIDRHEDDPRGGWWQTPDGARIGRIKLRELKELITAALATPPAATREAGPLPQAPTAAAMVAAYLDRYERTGPLEDPEPVCLAAALRAMPPGADLVAVIAELEVME